MGGGRMQLSWLGILGLLLLCAGSASGQGRTDKPTLDPSSWSKGFRKLPAAVMTDPGELPRLEVVDSEKTKAKAEQQRAQVPLKHTHVSAKITEFVAEVEVRQTYENSATNPIEVLYVFPLPENSAVNHMHMQIGEREINAEIKKRDEARRTYEKAKKQGHTAALLEQERPNVFTQSVANIPPKSKIEVVVRYVQDLSYDAGWYEFVFPMVVGPRYMPGEALSGPQSGSGTRADTTRVPDASRISPPYVGQGTRSGHDISLEVVANAGQPLTDIDIPTHQVVKQTLSGGALKVALKDQASVPNRDFVFRYRVADNRPRATLFTTNDSGPGYFSLVIQPPGVDVDSLVGRRELIFVVDVSGSMSGLPLSLCRDAIHDALGGLRPMDTFNVITFASGTKRLFESARPVNSATLQQAANFVSDLRAGGGTEMAKAIDAALAPRMTPGRHRYVFFLTDGFVGNEAELIEKGKRFTQAATSKDTNARVFTMGVGSSPNRHLIDGLSKAGRGVPTYVSSREDPLGAVNRFYHVIDQAILTDLHINWGGMDPRRVTPNQVPDLFASHALAVHGEYTKPPSSPLKISARAGKQAYEIQVVQKDPGLGDRSKLVLGSIWARGQINDFEELLRSGQSRGEAEAGITKLGLEFNLVTRYTSFVAVDKSRVVEGKPNTLMQPLDGPEGVDLAKAGESNGYGYEFEDDPLASGGYGPADTTLRASPAASPDSDFEVASKRGCGCQLPGSGSTRSAWALAIGLILAGLRRIRRFPRRRRGER
ncbi:MAG: VWA domain-containing protein [Polyangiaceae bacterium]|nr:VWA domain-containing protein [Polyangiaceae bacterium]